MRPRQSVWLLFGTIVVVVFVGRPSSPDTIARRPRCNDLDSRAAACAKMKGQVRKCMACMRAAPGLRLDGCSSVDTHDFCRVQHPAAAAPTSSRLTTQTANEIGSEMGTVGSLLAARLHLLPGVTLALHGDLGRLDVMLKSRAVWNASVALAILARSAVEVQAAEDMLERAEDEDGIFGGTLRWCVYMPPRMTLAEQLELEGSASSVSKKRPLWKYPANIMRNRALQLVETEQVMLLDADFIPTAALRAVARDGGKWLRPNQLLIVAPFQSRGDAVDWGDVQRSGTFP